MPNFCCNRTSRTTEIAIMADNIYSIVLSYRSSADEQSRLDAKTANDNSRVQTSGVRQLGCFVTDLRPWRHCPPQAGKFINCGVVAGRQPANVRHDWHLWQAASASVLPTSRRLQTENWVKKARSRHQLLTIPQLIYALPEAAEILLWKQFFDRFPYCHLPNR